MNTLEVNPSNQIYFKEGKNNLSKLIFAPSISTKALREIA